ncbi:hypothetical protein AAVH_00139 [Aphelenchoides avenae]|nr:hypothetical protein AAVH_00139 [Aphelenchus avenae]
MGDDAKQLIEEFRAQYPNAGNVATAELLVIFENLSSLPPRSRRRSTSKLSQTDAMIVDVKDSPDYKDIRDRADNLKQRQPQLDFYGTIEAVLFSLRQRRATQRKSLSEINGSSLDLHNNPVEPF